MPTFDTPEPIHLTIELSAGDARVTASERTDTVVAVRPMNAAAENDVRAAEQTRVEYRDGRLLIKTPKARNFGLFGKTASVEVTVALPAGSRVHGEGVAADFECTGQLGETRLKTSAGTLRVDGTGPLDLHTSAGAIAVGRVSGSAHLNSGTGRIQVSAVDGAAEVRNANGACWIGSVAGDLRVTTANGDIRVDRAGNGVQASTANGDIRIGEAVRGAVSIKTACGELEVGIPAGTAAYLDLNTLYGAVHNRLTETDAPAESEESVEVRARTSFGDIVIHRS
jgi:hypothetical protein